MTDTSTNAPTDAPIPKTLTDTKPNDAVVLRIDRPDGALSAVRIAARTEHPDAAPVAVLIPGFTGSKEDFYPVLGPLADLGFTVIAFSQRGQFDSEGHRHSEPPREIHGYELHTLGRDVHDVLDHFELTDSVHLLGHSFGGLIGIEAVLQNSGRFASYTMWNSGPRSRMMRPEAIAALTSGGSEELWRFGHPDQDPALVDPIERWFYDRLIATSSTQLLAAVRLLEEQTDRVHDLVESGVPVLVSHGDTDDAWPHDWQRDMAERVGGQYVVIRNAGHSAQVDQPEDSARVLTSFWRSAAAG